VNEDIMTLLLHCVTSGKLISESNIEEITDSFHAHGRKYICRIMKDFQSFDIFHDPGLIHHNKDFFVTNLEIWLLYHISYDSETHKSVTSLIEECSEVDMCIDSTNNICITCGLNVFDDSSKRTMRTRAKQSTTTCSNCNWYKLMRE